MNKCIPFSLFRWGEKQMDKSDTLALREINKDHMLKIQFSRPGF